MKVKGILQVKLFIRKGTPEELVQQVNGFLDEKGEQIDNVIWILNKSPALILDKVMHGCIVHYFDEYTVSKGDFRMPFINKQERLLAMIKGGMTLKDAKAKLADEILAERNEKKNDYR